MALNMGLPETRFSSHTVLVHLTALGQDSPQTLPSALHSARYLHSLYHRSYIISTFKASLNKPQKKQKYHLRPDDSSRSFFSEVYITTVYVIPLPDSSVLHTPPIKLFPISKPEYYLIKNTNYKPLIMQTLPQLCFS
jgi:hypothetical protein